MVYRRHVFLCVNQREAEKRCCNNHCASDLQAYMKRRVQELGLASPNGIRVNQAGCMGRCKLGPVMVIYPEGRWYTYHNETDIDEIIASDLQTGQVVTRLLIDKL